MPPTWPSFVPADTLVGQLLGQISRVVSIAYAICPRISQKNISNRLFHSQFSVFSSLWRRLVADKNPVACSARSEIVLPTVTQGGGRDGLTLGYILTSPTGTKALPPTRLRTFSGLCPLAVRSGCARPWSVPGFSGGGLSPTRLRRSSGLCPKTDDR